MIDSAAAVGVTYIKFGEMIQGFAAEISIASDLANNLKEESLVRIYSEALAIYRDSLQLWKASMDSPIDDAILYSALGWSSVKYGLHPIEHHERAGIMVLPEDSFRYLWSIASEKISQANSIYSGKAQKSEGQEALSSSRKYLYFRLNTLLNARLEMERRIRSIPKETEQQRLAREKEEDQTIYYMPFEKYYHRDTCSLLKEDARIASSVLWASKNKIPCPECKPPVSRNR